MATMKTGSSGDAIKTITNHYIDGTFVESHGREVMDIIRRLHEAASARVDDLTAAMIEEYGGVAQFSSLLVKSGINAFLAAEQALGEIPWTRHWDKTTVTMEPVGVAGLITAWNANVLFICLKLASAVAAGCTVVIKPSELSSLQTRVLVDALHEAGVPKGVFNVVTGLGTTVGAELVRNPDVAKISFTGSVGVGESIMRDGAATMKRVTLELGGKSPTILLDDAVLDQAVPAALVMAFMNSGQACAAGTRLLVPKSRLDQVKRAIIDAMPAFEAGYFVQPTVFVNVKNDMTIAQEEIFGPVLSVITYETEEDAIRTANDTSFGLHAFVSGTDVQRA